MLKRKEFITGAAVGLALAAAATAGGVLDWPGAHAQPLSPADALKREGRWREGEGGA